MRPVAYSHATRRGTFWIALQADGRWHIVFEGGSLDPHGDPQTAAEELANGYCTWPWFGDPSTLGISEDLGDWEAHFSR
ncbi:hypothetical protein HMPREF9702_03440 [Delftia acidovorans CCUG 15835]|nr:hypothetical protein HMPREF9702_03440 [Delftia acidovorans CCUG 15835]